MGRSQNTSPQINTIIFLRMNAAIEKRNADTGSNNKKGPKALHTKFVTDRNMNLASLWDNRGKLETQITETMKKEKRPSRNAMQNIVAKDMHTCYVFSHPRCFKIFKHPREVENKMDQLIQEGNYKNILKYAHKGNLTEKFLIWLIQLKVKYNQIRFDSSLDTMATFRRRCDLE